MIEDNLEYGIELAQAGIKVYLLDRPWNQHYDPKIHVGITKIFSWEELNI
ncbi:hypothetical protein KKG31_03695 [Patescibacteria group bacterium]|nr:hypothetical protein [Patescibacteria group bacterium]MBU1758248.1 hypothetical protein [Patescibacteria group bacterium]